MSQKSFFGVFNVKRFTESPNEIFVLITLVLYLTFFALISISSIHRFIYQIFTIDILHTFGTGPEIGPNKTLLFEYSFIFFVIVNCLLFIMFFKKKGLTVRLATFSVIIALYLISINNINYPIYSHKILEKLRIENLPSIEYESIFSKDHMLKVDIDTFDDFYRFAKDRYNSYEQILTKNWQINDEKKLKGIFYMNLVSAMWGYGIVNNRMVGSCTYVRKEGRWVLAPNVNIRSYIDSDYGFCIDHAHTLKYLLDKENIDNRLASYPGHTFNEVQFGDGWYILDASTNMMFHSTWNEIQKAGDDKSEQVRVTVFPHSNLVYKSNPFYRSEIGQFRISVLLSALDKTTGPLTYPKLPSWFQ